MSALKRYPTIDDLLAAEPETLALFGRTTRANDRESRMRAALAEAEITLKFAKERFEDAKGRARKFNDQTDAVYERVGAKS